MKIALFGASGGTGTLLTNRCFASGHQVSALLRSPDIFPLREKVDVIYGDACDPHAVLETVRGADVVLSALGARSLGKEDVLERGVPNIVAAMQQTGVHRIIALGSAGALPDSLKKQPFYRRWIVQKILYNTLLRWPVASQIAQYATLSATDLDWTIVMPPMLRNTTARGRYRIDGEALPRNGSSISREDVADFMMQQLTDSQWIRKGVYISL
ncbi:MAG TPA: SDR family oxidoreductase [Edaphobacter sp.]|nr:SDR family oxidoreductase [Edaphobacter sp.]